jgi:MYXO-CTERM domain-containing protein
MHGARFRLGLGAFGVLCQAYFAATGPPEYDDPYRPILFCMWGLLALMGACGLVLRRRSAKSTVYATENGGHEPQDTENDQ